MSQSGLFVGVFSFEPNFGVGTLYPEAPRSVEIMVMKWMAGQCCSMTQFPYHEILKQTS